MNIEEIRNGAPDKTASHYWDMRIIERVMYFKKVYGEIFWFSDCDKWESVRKLDGVLYEKSLRGKIKPLF